MIKPCKNLDLIVGDKDRVSEFVAEHIHAKMQRNNGKIVLGAAGGSSTAGVYRAMVSMGIDTSGITAFAPDEYFGTDDQLKNIQKQLPRAKVHAPRAIFYRDNKKIEIGETIHPELAKEIRNSCEEYENQIKNIGRIDILLLGLGLNPDGHIASVMPGNLNVDDRTHLERYPTPHSVSTGATNYAITMGLGTILEAKETVLLAFGEDKAGIVSRTLYCPVHGGLPASYLRESSNRMLVCLDYDAAKNLCKFYRSSMEI